VPAESGPICVRRTHQTTSPAEEPDSGGSLCCTHRIDMAGSDSVELVRATHRIGSRAAGRMDFGRLCASDVNLVSRSVEWKWRAIGRWSRGGTSGGYVCHTQVGSRAAAAAPLRFVAGRLAGERQGEGCPGAGLCGFQVQLAAHAPEKLPGEVQPKTRSVAAGMSLAAGEASEQAGTINVGNAGAAVGDRHADPAGLRGSIGGEWRREWRERRSRSIDGEWRGRG
jgi:hypothetical protein